MQMHIFDFFYAAKIFTNSTSKTDKVFVDLVAFLMKCKNVILAVYGLTNITVLLSKNDPGGVENIFCN